ncbi:MAG: preprotein translocase subunit SecG [Rickettsiales bacterium]|jgi:preprotein translocase subunit SecG|nr:preprotein translocase subunit SecG [Rickettsiales bacterium]
MINTLFVLNIIVVLLMIGIILLQKSEGGVLGMGGGSRGALFTTAGAGNLITKTTWVLGSMFFVICLVLAFLVARENGQAKSFIETMQERQAEPAKEAKDAAAPALPSAPTE